MRNQYSGTARNVGSYSDCFANRRMFLLQRHCGVIVSEGCLVDQEQVGIAAVVIVDVVVFVASVVSVVVPSFQCVPASSNEAMGGTRVAGIAQKLRSLRILAPREIPSGDWWSMRPFASVAVDDAVDHALAALPPTDQQTKGGTTIVMNPDVLEMEKRRRGESGVVVRSWIKAHPMSVLASAVPAVQDEV